MISLSAIIASLLFIILTNYHLLPGTEKSITEVVSNGDYGGRLQINSHPYDSIKEIWGWVPIFLIETALSLVLFEIGRLFKTVIRKIKKDL
ncbi:MAG: hypothetical protein K2H32_10140 [Muribaculaceae bacterium]|nr:hypothetical protein [Muribaculaceae bacterium]